MTRKRVAPDSLRLWIYTEQKTSPAFGDLPRKNIHARRPPALGRSSAKSLSSLRRFTPKKHSRQTASSFGSILCEKPLQPLEMYPEKIFPPDSFRLLVDPLRKAPLAFEDVPRKNIPARQLSALGRYPAKSPTSLRNCALKRRSGQAASSFGEILCEKSHHPSELCSEKTFRPGRLQLWGDPLRKATPAFGNVSRKNIPARQPSALGQFSAKSLASLRRYTPEKCLRPSASGCLFPPTARLPKWPTAMTRKSAAPNSLRLLVDPFRKISPAARCDDPKKCSFRQPSTLDLY